jgi:DNA-binding transcriptional ArsR family regulator
MKKPLTVQQDGCIFDDSTVTFDQRAKQLRQEEILERKQEEKARDSPYSRWAQYNLEHSDKLIWLQMNHPKSAAILTFLVDHMDTTNAIMCSYHVLQEVFGVSADTVRRALKILKEKGFVAVYKSGLSNVYVINDCLYWKSWGNNIKYSKFPATVILSLTEQEQAEQTRINAVQQARIKQLSV